MVVPLASRTCAYRGMTTVYFRTYTTTYPFIESGWEFNPACFEPMELHAYSQNLLPLALQGKLITLANGYTTFQFGDKTHADDEGFGGATYNGKSLLGWFFGTSLESRFYRFEYGLREGNPYTKPTLQMQQNTDLPGTNNIGAPRPFFGGNFPYTDGVWTSAVNELVTWSFLAPYGGGIIRQENPPDFGLGSFLSANAGMYANGVNYMSIDNGTDPSDNTFLMETDYLTYARHYGITWENPPGGFDLNAYMLAQHNLGNISKSGWLQSFLSNETIGTIMCNGGLIVTSPDCTSYIVVRLIPLDAQAKTWNTGFGSASVKLDSGGALWIKGFDSDSVLFVSAGSVIKQLPIFPPLPIPSQSDSDPILKLVRSH